MVFLFCSRPSVLAPWSDSDCDSASSSASASPAATLYCAGIFSPSQSPPLLQTNRKDPLMIVQEEEEKKEGHQDQDQEQSSVEETVEDEEEGWESTTPVPVVTKRTHPKTLAIVPDTPTTANTTMMSIDSQVYDDDITAVADNRGGTVQSVGASSMDLVSANSWLSHNHYIEDDPFLEESDESSAGNWEPILDPDLEDEEEQENQTITLFPTAPQSQEIQDYDVEVEIDLESAILPLLQEKSTMPYQNRQARSAAAAVTATSSSTDKSKQDTGKNRFTKILVINVIVTILMATGILDVDDLLSRPIFSFTHYQNNYNPDQPHLASFLFLQRDTGNSSTIPTRQQRTLRRNTRRTVKSHETTVTTQKREYQNSTFAKHTPWLEDLNDEEPQFQGLLRTDSIFFKISTNTHNKKKTTTPQLEDDTNWTQRLQTLRGHAAVQQEQRPPVVVLLWRVLSEQYKKLDIKVRGHSQLAQFKQQQRQLQVARTLLVS
ncbi:expressed unknown protein [Seminavis robusta]|uniref:Uncharacterized protein n=1 Tax=Seminavis robusta TaxID=568900 RepID=A0A9N8DZP1_9STRA|nr:expressed unknown protein [Seminavis robusta]|eukprot:Sro481_g151600.1 n/a (490) ;mRNA; f:36806-38275